MSKSNSFMSIPSEGIPAMMGKQVHLMGMAHGCTWNLIKVEKNIATLQTPKSKKILTADVGRLLYSRKNLPTTAPEDLVSETYASIKNRQLSKELEK